MLDVTDLAAMQAAIAAAAPFNILVNNAGTNRPKPLIDVTVEDFDVDHGAERARRLFRRAGGGAAADRGEAAGLDHQHLLADGPCRRARSARSIAPRKHAMEGFTKAMAIELAPHDIRVNSLGPTFIETPLTKPFFENEAFRKDVLSKIKLGRIGQMDELTGAIVFLASDASRLMTGSALVVDGGWTAE